MTAWPAILEADLRWREAELASLKRIAITNSNNEVTLRATLRAAWAMLYAHFEGFTKFCWELLFDQVQKSDLATKELSREFLLLALEKRFRQLRGDTSSVSLWGFYSRELPSALVEKATFAQDCRLDPENNLWPIVFKKECAKVGIISVAMELHKARMEALVSRRNDIAHGKSMVIKSVNEYSEYENATLIVLHDLAVHVLEILEKEKFKESHTEPAKIDRPDDGQAASNPAALAG